MNDGLRKRRLVEMTEQGYSQRDAARVLGVSQMTVSRWQRELHLSPAGHASERSREKKRRAAARTCVRNGVRSLNEFKRLNEELARLKEARRGLDGRPASLLGR